MLSSKAGLDDIPESEFHNKRVLMRVDFNVPLNADLQVSDKTRILSTIPTINKILSMKVKSLVLMSHLGRPDGTIKPKYSLKPTVSVLEECLEGRKVLFMNDCVGLEVEEACRDPVDGTIILLENLRFHIEEEGSGIGENKEKIKADKKKVEEFRNSLTKLGDVYVNDAFGTAHRPHSSIVGINLKIKCAGLLMKKELEYFSIAMEKPMKPFLTILGGAKVKDKIKLISSLLEKGIDSMIIGGGMAFTFLKVMDKIEIGDSLFDEEGSLLVEEIVQKAKSKNVKLIIPKDWVCGNKFSKDCEISNHSSSSGGIPKGWMGMDVGKETLEIYKSEILKSKTIVWNGPQGVFEFPNFAHGSQSVLDFVIEATKLGAKSIVGGGDTASLVESVGKSSLVSHVSTGGGASLELLEGKELPGLSYLSDKKEIQKTPKVAV